MRRCRHQWSSGVVGVIACGRVSRETRRPPGAEALRCTRRVGAASQRLARIVPARRRDQAREVTSPAGLVGSRRVSQPRSGGVATLPAPSARPRGHLRPTRVAPKVGSLAPRPAAPASAGRSGPGRRPERLRPSSPRRPRAAPACQPSVGPAGAWARAPAPLARSAAAPGLSASLWPIVRAPPPVSPRSAPARLGPGFGRPPSARSAAAPRLVPPRRFLGALSRRGAGLARPHGPSF